jgi:hypothetical protein
MPLAFRLVSPAPGFPVSRVVGRSPENQMLIVTAGWIVTAMADVQTFGDGAVLQLVGNAVCVYHLPVPTDLTIPLLSPDCSPLDATGDRVLGPQLGSEPFF